MGCTTAKNYRQGVTDFMDFGKAVLDIATNPVLFVPAVAWCVAQLLKVIINAIVNRKFDISRLVGDGGMPSGHSATVTALATMCGLTSGFDSPLFGLSMIFAIVVMHDASGVRREAGKQAVSIKKIADMLNNHLFSAEGEHEEFYTDTLKVFVGHTRFQVFCGAALGIGIALLYFFVIAPAIGWNVIN